MKKQFHQKEEKLEKPSKKWLEEEPPIEFPEDDDFEEDIEDDFQDEDSY